ncbi:tetratricopeptide repeat-containing sulfotransferase family protein [Thalassococcus lentus]|uniref:Sulfotransferase n=1 Tax=Thalassococcus lentus TaxID=1210524 RepID=A0ABT4XT66_9RHOB|nr:tetratricopeptide repeat-containing sulfotransferase family protein [Thalassococcus lentus]MDA7425159.1 sulfotransferase [Thalassococcus lentus]
MMPLAQQDPKTVLNRAKALFEQGQFETSKLHFIAVLQKAPQHAESYIFLSRIAFELGDRDACLEHLRKAADLIPDNPRVWMALADRHRHFGNETQALASYDKAIALSPKDITPRADKAHFLQLIGEFTKAEAQLVKLIKNNPGQPELFRILSATRKSNKRDPLLREMLGLWKRTDLAEIGRMHLGYALAKAMSDLGEHDRVFGYLDQANAIQAKLAPYDHAGRKAEVEGVLSAQTGPFDRVGPSIAPAPVFVCGMPRSGTTLVEQIIAAHSTAQPGGELSHSLQQAYKHFGTGAEMRATDTMQPEILTAFAQGYERLVQRDFRTEATVLTDKSIQSILVFGLLHAAITNARLIVVLRDPRDVALSIYRNYFSLGTHRYACRFSDIAKEIKLFRVMLRHWQERLPDAVHVIKYEDLVSDPENGARRLLKYAEMDWEDRCLDFHKERSTVQTLSVAQVRQPIHSGRREAWRRYESALEPFVNAWGDEPWD